MSDIATTDLEKQSLEAHVDLCALRYKNLDDRMTKIEKKVEEIIKSELSKLICDLDLVIVTTMRHKLL